MKLLYNNGSELSGIYKISNVKNGRIYIGSASCFRKRAKGHLNALVAKEHANKFLQNDFNKCGTDAFIFEVLEVISDKTKIVRLSREQLYIDQYYDDQKQCYNLVNKAQDSRGGTRNKKEIDPLTDKRCKSPSKKIIQKRAQAIKEAKATPEQKELAKQNCLNGLWKDHSANVTLVNLTTKEEVFVSTSLRQFATERNLSYKALHLLTKGKIKSSGGWYVKEKGEPKYVSQKGEKRKPLTAKHRNKIAGSKFLGIKVLSPRKKIVSLPANIKTFCRQKKIDYSTFIKVLNGKGKSCCGWTLVK